MKYFLVIVELGLLLVDEKKEHVISDLAFPGRETAKSFLESSSGTFSESQISWLKSKLTPGDIFYAENQLVNALASTGLRLETVSDNDQRELSKNKLGLMVSSGLVDSEEKAEEAVRDASLEISNIRVKEMSAKPDLQAMESVQALDEIDKASNMISSRVREWYGLHFPELVSMIDDNVSLIRLILSFKSRSNYDEGELEQLGYSKNKSNAIVTAAKESRGAELRDEDLARIVQLAEEAEHLFSLRDKLANHVEKTMRQVAPNVSGIAGASIGARLIARAGGLEKLSILPASTIQILGAEKALYRALKSGSRPPKHGILFQHAAVHSAPKWQRGRIARAVAGKIAIAARIDQYRGTKDPVVERSLETRLDEIKIKYKEAPKERLQYVAHKRSEFKGESEMYGRRERRSGRKNRDGRNRKPQRKD